jgi:hypothetical protein
MTPGNPAQVAAEQAECLKLRRDGKNRTEISEITGLSHHQVKRRIAGGLKAERLDPELRKRLAAKGITDLAGLHSGWLLEKDQEGSGSSLYFYLGPDQEKIDFADALKEILSEIPKLPTIPEPSVDGSGYANWIALADLHVGSGYGDPQLEVDFNSSIDDLVRRMPAAEKAVLFELGDLLDANDHKGVTPTSGNLLEVRKNDHLKNTMTAVSLLRRAVIRLSETHHEVEVHLIKGNHDTTAYIAVMLALAEHFRENPRINIVVTDDEFRVISWGLCAAFPHHGDTLKWSQLKDVFADQFADQWAAAKSHRHILTAHLHSGKREDMLGCVAEQFRTLSQPNGWARGKGLFSRGSLTAITVHKDRGEESRTTANIKNTKDTQPTETQNNQTRETA